MRLAASVVLAFMFSAAVWCQAQRPQFEVASIKASAPATDGTLYGHMIRDPGRVSYLWVTVQNLVSLAYRIKNIQISGPGWFDSDRFDILAKLPSDVGDDDIREMLKTLLEERFGLAFHIETKNRRAYGLLPAKGGPKFNAVGGDIRDVQTRINGTGRRLSGKVTMPYLAGLLSNLVDRPVVDVTGLKGIYDIDLEWSDDSGALPADQGNDVPDLFTALQERLGLRFDNRSAPVEVYVIDRVERIPTEN